MASVTTEARSLVEPATEAAPVRPEPYRMTVEVYEKIVEAGVFGDKSPIYLWKGQLVLPMTKGPSHGYSLTALHELFRRLLPDGWDVRQECPTRLHNDSEPEPDLTVVRGRNRDYKDRTPDAHDVSLLIEVANSSQTFDSGEKLGIYAAASIPVYWIVNIPNNRIDVYTGPTGPTETPTYTEHRSYGPGEAVPVVLDGREVGRIAAGDVLP